MAHSANDMMADGSITYSNGSTSMRMLVIIAAVFLLIKCRPLGLPQAGESDCGVANVPIRGKTGSRKFLAYRTFGISRAVASSGRVHRGYRCGGGWAHHTGRPGTMGRRHRVGIAQNDFCRSRRISEARA